MKKVSLWLFIALSAVSAGVLASDYTIVVSDTRVANYGEAYNVKAYGALGDGSTDDTDAIQIAIDACEAADNGTVVFPPGDYLVTETITIATSTSSDEIAVSMYGATILADTTLNGPVLTIGDNVSVMGGTITTNGDALDWDGTVGIKISDGYRSRIIDTQVRNMEKGIELAASTGHGCVYNYVSPRMIYDCKFGIYLTQAGSGWTNDNHIANASIYYSTAVDVVDCSDGAAIWASPAGGATAIMENNLFIGLSLENGSAQADSLIADAIYGTFYNSQFIGCRVESFDGAADTLSSINIQSAGEGNVFIGGSGLEIYKFRYQRETGSYNGRRRHRMVGEYQNKSGGGPVLELHTRGSYNTQPVFDVLAADYDTLFAVRGDGSVLLNVQPAEPDTIGKRAIFWYDGVNSDLKFYDGTSWVNLTP